MRKELKKILGKDAEEERIDLAINIATELIKNYCQIKKVPDGLYYTLIRMAADIYKNEYGSSEESQTVVSSLKEGDTTISFSENKESVNYQYSILKNYTKQLNAYRKPRGYT